MLPAPKCPVPDGATEAGLRLRSRRRRSISPEAGNTIQTLDLHRRAAAPYRVHADVSPVRAKSGRTADMTDRQLVIEAVVEDEAVKAAAWRF